MTRESLDCIKIEGLRFLSLIGVNDWEQVARQTIEIDITIYAELDRAIKSDSIEDTINYRTLSQDIKNLAENSQFELIETLAEAIVNLCLKHPLARKAEVNLRKPGAVRLADSVGVNIIRSQLYE